MTVEERFERLEHFVAGLAEQSRRDRLEDRALWRDTQQQINQISRKMADVEDQFLRFQAEADARDERFRERMTDLDRASRERDQKLDERIDKLVSAIGTFIASQSRPKD